MKKGAATEFVLERAMVNDHPQAVTVLAAKLERPIPKQFALHQNYPNPFNPETKIRFDLPEFSEEKAKTLIAIYQYKRPIGARAYWTRIVLRGTYEITWDARTNAGLPVPYGMYVYTIKAGDFKDTKKMLLLK